MSLVSYVTRRIQVYNIIPVFIYPRHLKKDKIKKTKLHVDLLEGHFVSQSGQIDSLMI